MSKYWTKQSKVSFKYGNRQYTIEKSEGTDWAEITQNTNSGTIVNRIGMKSLEELKALHYFIGQLIPNTNE